MTKIKIGLFGFGVVGQGIYEVVRKSKNAHAEIVKICVRDPKKPRKIEVDPSLFTTSVDDILDNQNINLVVEVIDDADAAYNIVKRAMLRGIPVVSGSKTMLAKHLPELIEIQKTRNVALLYDASSCGSIPVIRNLEQYYASSTTRTPTPTPSRRRRRWASPKAIPRSTSRATTRCSNW